MISRRQWLSGSLALLAARFDLACSSDTGSSNGAHHPPKTDLERWQGLLTALRQSPDNLTARADAAVASKDPRLIFAFVRDYIATVPPLDAMESIETGVRFGVDNLLRSGAGTPRERAELLVALLDRAGLSASVVKGDPDGALSSLELSLIHISEPTRPY